MDENDTEPKEPSSYFYGIQDRLQLIADGLDAIRKAQECIDGKSSPLTFLLQDYAESVKEVAQALQTIAMKADEEWVAEPR